MQLRVSGVHGEVAGGRDQDVSPTDRSEHPAETILSAPVLHKMASVLGSVQRACSAVRACMAHMEAGPREDTLGRAFAW